MKRTLDAAVALSLATTATTSWSQSEDDRDVYVVPQAGYVWLDNDRGADDDRFLGLAVGKRFTETLSLELTATDATHDLPAPQELDLRAYSLDLLHNFMPGSRVSPYVTVGAGALRTAPSGQDSHTHIMGQAGLGLMIHLAEKNDGSLRFGLRPEVKARMAFPQDNDPQDKFLDYTAGLGFLFTFGSARPAPEPVAEPAPPPPPVAPAPPPAPRDSDDRDRCPDTPPGVAVDADGCPRRGSATLQGVTFEFNSAVLTSASRPVLDMLAADLKRYPRLKIELQGHTDSVGNDAYNLRLSEKRAQAVRDYLVSQGVGEQQLTARGFGENVPVADNTTEDGRAQNRRVVMTVLDNPGNVEIQIQRPSTDGAR
jgi:OOP family OmpA-OmpF porin